ncbi:MAG: nitroreductase [Prolixibacteraceae bacterium]|nr:nitroreductase [Prolixibacteraceae bacterium]MBN2774046.1 nitroreductase [Prolixibacteraceae bacterium]
MNISELNIIIQNRRATPAQFFNGKEIPDDMLNQILENANWAPNHKQTEPWRFIVFRGDAKEDLGNMVFNLVVSEYEKGNKVDPGKADKFRKNVQKTGAVIAIILNRSEDELLPEWEEIAAVSMAVQNMWLTATSMGLAAFWATPKFINLLDKVLELEPSQKCLGFFYIGKTNMDYPSPGRGDMNEKVRWVD